MIKVFLKPTSVEEAVECKRVNPGSIYFGGGTGINYAGSKAAGECVISLEGVGLTKITTGEGRLSIGSTVTLQELIDSPLVPDVLKKAAGFVYSRNIRNMATVGGNIGANRTDSALIPCLTALSAMVHTCDSEVLSVTQYGAGDREPLILSVQIPEQKGVCAVRKISRSVNSWPVITTAVSMAGNGTGMIDVVVAVGGIKAGVVRLSPVEERILSGELENTDTLRQAVSNLVEPVSDRLGSCDYKKYICGVLVADCVAECREGMK